MTNGDARFRQKVTTTFDGSDVRPDIVYAVAPGIDAGSGPVATIRLTGQIPPGAQSFTWVYAWTFTAYSMTVRHGDGDLD